MPRLPHFPPGGGASQRAGKPVNLAQPWGDLGKTGSILTMRMTSKGQITIPLELRRRYGLGAGVEVEILATEDGALVRPAAAQSRGRDLVARLRDRADGGLDADEILSLTRGDTAA
jgi:AbrB family looped-hinge helix DNA binding protein